MKRPLAAVLALAALPATAFAVLPAGGGTVDVTASDGKLAGGPQLLGSVSAVGDFTGDRAGDLAVVQKGPQVVRVIHGGALDGARAVDGATSTVLSSSRAVSSVAGAGDVNGDGIGDLVVGSCDPAAADPGRVWVVFGRAGTAPIDLDNLGAGGFAVSGAGEECLGRSVATAGDFNGDGKGDVIAGAHKANSFAGRALVILGPGGTGSVELAGPADSRAGTFVAGLGDVNGDGLPDVGVGAPTYDDNAMVEAGAVFVVFGRAATAPITLASDASAFRIVGGGEGAHAGPVAPAGDVNHDKLADVAVGAPGPNTQPVVGVLFGTADTAQKNTASFGAGGYRFRDTTSSNRFGFDVRGGFDVNADGIPDVIAGAPEASVGSSPEKLRAGKAYVLFGRATGDNVTNVGDPAFDAQGIEILGSRGEQVGAQTQDPSLIGYEHWLGLGDVNCDGAGDVLLGTGAARIAGGGSDPGAVFIHRGAGGTPGSCGAGGPGGGGGPGPSPTPAPTTTAPGGNGQVVRIVRAKLKNSKLRVGRRPTAISSARRAPFGTTVQYELSEAATVTFKVTCDRPKGKQKAFCKKLKRSTFTRKVRTAGKSTFVFTGRIGKKKLVLGRYAITLVATDADGSSAPKKLRFKVVRR